MPEIRGHQLTHPDLLTDEDIATRHAPKRIWVNRWYADETAKCVRCHSEWNAGTVFTSCCESYHTMDEACESAKDSINKMIREAGYEFVSWLGPVEIEAP